MIKAMFKRTTIILGFIFIFFSLLNTNVFSQNQPENNPKLKTQSRTAKEIYTKSASAIVLIKTQNSGGTGFLVSNDGLIITAAHVVENASRVAVKLQTGEIFDHVDLLALDLRKDIAILAIHGFDLPFVELGNSNQITPGEQMIVLSNPLAEESLSASVSEGLLSGIRDFSEGFKVFQITSPISSGSSGGAVFSEEGKVIGIVSFKIIKGESLNFAIPINYAQGIIESVSKDKPIKSWKAEGDLFTDKSKKQKNNMTGVWRARIDGQILRIVDTTYVSVINVTYPEANSEAFRVREFIVGKVHGQLFKNWYVVAMDNENQLSFYFLKIKPKESEEKMMERIKKRIAKNPDTILYRIE